AFGASGGAGIIIAGGTNASNLLGNQNATLDLRNVAYNTVQTMYLAGGTLATTVGTSSWAGSVFVNANSTILVQQGSTLNLKGTFGGDGAVTQLGGGVLVLSGQADPTTRNTLNSSFNVPNHTVQAGILRLDYTTNNSSKLADTGALVLGGSRFGGALELVGGSHLEIVAGVTLGAGDNRVSRLSGTSILRMNGISRQAGAKINFSGNDIASTDTNNTVGILGSWATVSDSSWATKSSFNESLVNTLSTTAGDLMIRAYTDYTRNEVNNDWTISSTTGNMDFIANTTQTNRVANTLRFNTPVSGGGVSTVTLSGANTLQGGAILVSPNMGSGESLINGSGTLSTGRVGTTVNDLLIIQNNTTASFEISSSIIDNTASRADRSGTIASGSNLVRNINGADLAVGMLVTGSGIAAGTTITALSSVATVSITSTSGNSVFVSSVPSNLFVGATLLGRTVTDINGTIITLDGAPTETIAATTTREFQTNTITLSSNPSASATQTLQFSQDRSGTTAAGSTSVTGLNGTNGTNGLYVGMKVSGLGIVDGTTITAITANSSITLSNAAVTGAGTGTLTFSQVTGLDKTGLGNLILSGMNLYTGVTTLNAGITTIQSLGIEGYTTGTQMITNLSSTGRTLTVDSTGLTIGTIVTGGALPAGVTIAAITNPTTVTLSNGALISTTGSSLTFNNSGITAQTGTIAAASNTSNNTVTVAGGTTGLAVGQKVDGTGISNAGGQVVILSIVNSTQITIGVISGSVGVAYIPTAAASSLSFGSANLYNGSRTGNTQSGTQIVVGSTLGMTVGQTISGNGIPANSTIVRILDQNTIEISNPVTTTGQNNLSFGASTSIGATLLASTTNGSAMVTVPTTANLSVGELVSGPGIPLGATITKIIDGTTIYISVSAIATGSNTLVFAGPASSLGASRNTLANLVFNGGTLQFNGTSASSDRGFTINQTAVWDVGNAYTVLTLGGN
ncbi:MAG: hypothetical protein B7Z23_02335, partial [Pseudomonadales bacterium 32-61-5]